jgi:hypothetical protein
VILVVPVQVDVNGRALVVDDAILRLFVVAKGGWRKRVLEEGFGFEVVVVGDDESVAVGLENGEHPYSHFADEPTNVMTIDHQKLKVCLGGQAQAERRVRKKGIGEESRILGPIRLAASSTKPRSGN